MKLWVIRLNANSNNSIFAVLQPTLALTEVIKVGENWNPSTFFNEINCYMYPHKHK